MRPSPPATQPPPDDAPERPESTSPPRWLGLDRLGVLQMLGGIALSLIALFSSYDHNGLDHSLRTLWHPDMGRSGRRREPREQWSWQEGYDRG